VDGHAGVLSAGGDVLLDKGVDKVPGFAGFPLLRSGLRTVAFFFHTGILTIIETADIIHDVPGNCNPKTRKIFPFRPKDSLKKDHGAIL
jgi:hypothetical protein